MPESSTPRTAQLDAALDKARAQHLAGRLAEAESTYRWILSVAAENDVALHALGLIARQKGKLDLAAKLLQRAVTSNPAQPRYLCDLGLVQIGRGKLDEAGAQLEAALALSADDVHIYCSLGSLRLAQHRTDDALANFGRAVAVDPRQSAAHFGLGLALYAKGMLDESEACFRRVIDLDPASGDALGNLGLVCHSKGMFEEAIGFCHRALAVNPDDSIARNTLGLALNAQGDLEEAAACFRKALSLNPDYAEAHNNLGIVFSSQGQLQEAAACFRRALVLRPGFIEAHGNLGNALRAQGRVKQAIASFRNALAISPNNPQALNNLGVALQMDGRADEARTLIEKAIAAKPDWHVAYNNLAAALLALGEPERALDCCRKAVELRPDYLEAHQKLLFCMNYVSGLSAAAIHAEHARFGEVFEAPLKARWQPHANAPDPERRLRIGYVSGDFYQHAVAHMVEPALAGHDKTAYEIFCYTNGTRQDEITDRLRAHADHWCSLVNQNNDAAAALIRGDGIDILVDLSGHTGGNRLMVFARKPAPVQVSWIGYQTTTGLTAIDYRITDPYTDPPGQSEAYHTETLWRLPCVSVFRPPEGSPPVGPQPALTRGSFTFACLNAPAKITPDAVGIWARILNAVPNACLMLGGADEGEMRNRLLGQFARNGVDQSRLLIKPRLPLLEYLRLHQEIDLALDTFPYNGGATSCHSLWMGVPFVTLAGDRYMSRMGVSLLVNLGLPDLIANSPDEYVALACRLASDPSRLAGMRAGLRARMAASPLLNGVAFTRSLESAYRAMWRAWCASASTRPA